jgi:hypothetical protein
MRAICFDVQVRGRESVRPLAIGEGFLKFVRKDGVPSDTDQRTDSFFAGMTDIHGLGFLSFRRNLTLNGERFRVLASLIKLPNLSHKRVEVVVLLRQCYRRSDRGQEGGKYD